jgi:hypothetical protein
MTHLAELIASGFSAPTAGQNAVQVAAMQHHGGCEARWTPALRRTSQVARLPVA